MVRYLGIQRENAFGTGVYAKMSYIDIAQENIEADNQIIILDGQTTEPRRFAEGPFKLGGGFQAPADAHLTGHYLFSVLGMSQADDTPNSDGKSHLFWPGPTLYPYSIELGYEAVMRKQIVSWISNSLTIEAVAGEVAQCSLEGIAQTLAIDESPAASVTWGLYDSGTYHADTPLFKFHEGAVKIGDESKDVESFKWTCTTNVVEDALKLGSRVLYKNIMQKREMKVNIDMAFDSKTEYQRFFGGKDIPTTDTPQNEIAAFELDLTMTSNTLISGSDPYKLQLYFPRTLWNKTGGPTLSGRDRLMYSLETPDNGILFADATYLALATTTGDPTLTGYEDWNGGIPADPTEYAMVAILDNAESTDYSLYVT